MAIRFQPNYNQAAQQPLESELVPVPELGNSLSRTHTNNVIRVHTQVKDASVSSREFLLKSIVQIIAGIALVVFGALSIHSGLGVAAVIIGAGLIFDGCRNAYGAYYAREINVADEATHALVEQHVRHPELAIAGNGGGNANQIQLAVANALAAERQQQAARPAARMGRQPIGAAPVAQGQRVGGFPAFGGR